MENTTAHDEYEDYTTFPVYKTGLLIWKVVPPILILFGTIGNILSIVILTRKAIKVSTTALYLSFLAVSDLIVLYTGLLRQWLIYLFDYDVRHISEATCKIHIWLLYTSLDFSAWIVMVVTMERAISAWFPHTAKSKCNRKSATVIVITILCFLIVLNSHLLYGMVNSVETDEKGNVLTVLKCSTINTMYQEFFDLIWPWIDLCVFCLLPFSVIVIGNCSILYKVVKSQRKAKSRIVPSSNTSNNNHQTSPKHLSMTAMLFTLNMVFLFTTSPVSIYTIGYPHWVSHETQQMYATLDFWWAAVNMLMYTNNTLNFVLYCMSGTRFRREVKRAFNQTTNASRDHNIVPKLHSEFPSRLPPSVPSRIDGVTPEQETICGLKVPHNQQLNSAESLFGSCNSLHPSSAFNTSNGSISMTRNESINPFHDNKTNSFKLKSCNSTASASDYQLSIVNVQTNAPTDDGNKVQVLPSVSEGRIASDSNQVSDIQEAEIYASYMEDLEQNNKLAISALSVNSNFEKPVEKRHMHLSTISGNADIEIKVESVSTL